MASNSTAGEGLLANFRRQIQSSLPSALDVSVLSDVVEALKQGTNVDDRKMLLEHVFVLISRLPASTLQTKLENSVVTLLYHDLPHPPPTYLGVYAWRRADGSGNTPSDPQMGQAGTPYARSVQRGNPLPRYQLPDAGLVFDTLLRRDKFVPHPGGLSSMMFSFSTLIFQTIFRTSRANVNINETSSYLDLSPLYGHTQEVQDRIRSRNGRGHLHPDTFADDRLLSLPPTVCAILILFNRNHNYIASKLLEINERGNYVDPAKLSSNSPSISMMMMQQDEDIFQTTRLINCTWFASVVFSDYLGAVLGMTRQGNSWSINPFGEIRQEDHTLLERGRGNVSSVEFNCLYRWHATTSREDEQWVNEYLSQSFSDKQPEQLTIPDFRKMTKQEDNDLHPDPAAWVFGGLQRQENGTFKDAELAAILHNATDHAAGAFKARGIPQSMRIHEILGIEQSRRWGVCSLNEFRKFLGLRPYETFYEWNADPEIASAAEKLYGDIDYLELYAGLQAEETKPIVDGAGLCPPYTISRAILSDIISLARGDRFFTAEFTPFNLTAWGFQDCQRDPVSPGFGSVLGRLFLRTLPTHFKYNSVYTWFPFLTRNATNVFLSRLEMQDQYDFGEPVMSPDIPDILDYRGIVEVLNNPHKFIVPQHAALIVQGKGFFISSNNEARARIERGAVIRALTAPQNPTAMIFKYFYQKTRDLMQKESWISGGSTTRNVDIARDVLKYIPLYWACEMVGIPLKLGRPVTGDGFTPKEMWEMLSVLYTYLFLDVEPVQLLNLQEESRRNVRVLLAYLDPSSKAAPSSLSISGIFKAVSNAPKHVIPNSLSSRLSEQGYESGTVANALLALLIGSTVEMSQALTHLVNFFLVGKRRDEILSLCNEQPLTTETEHQLQSLVLEGLRIDPAFRGVYRDANGEQILGDVTLENRRRVFVNIAKANINSSSFPSPDSVDTMRSPRGSYLFGDGCERCLGQDLATKIMVHVLRAIFSLPDLRRAPGQSGTLKRFPSSAMRTSTYVYLGKEQKQTPWATSMVVQFDWS